MWGWCPMGVRCMQVGESEEEERQFVGDYVYTGDEPRETIPVKVGGGELVRWSFLLHGTLITEGEQSSTVLTSLPAGLRPIGTLCGVSLPLQPRE